ncbi:MULTISPECIES: flagellar export chaperone FliS [unclassified Lysobacter]
MHSARSYANQYRQTNVNSAVLEASPHQLVALMLAGARARARLAIACLERGDLPRKAKAISDASAIIGGLNGALDMKAGGEIADGLQQLYDYAQRRLLDANVGNDSAPLIEIEDLLGEIETAWSAIAPGQPGAAGPSPDQARLGP